MSLRPTPSLEERIARLERAVAEIHAHLGLTGAVATAPEPAPSAPGGAEAAPPARDAAVAPPAGDGSERWAYHSQQWLGRVGLVLLFLGLVYLFNYSIEQGWITPVVRVLIGLAIGTALLVSGLRLEKRRRSYSQILLAGALAAYYVSGFAASYLFALVGEGVALVYMAAVMVLAFVLARRQDHPSLASLGALGGFAAPLLVHRGGTAVMELSVYSALVVGWTGVLYWLRGWPSLLWTYAAGSLAALGIAANHAQGAERGVVQAVLVLAWALAAALPFARGIYRKDARTQRFWGAIPLAIQLRVLGVGVTTTTLLLTDHVWALQDRETGLLFLLSSLLFAALAWVGTATPNRIARAAAPVAAALLATGTFLVLEHETARVALLSVEAFLFVRVGGVHRFGGTEWVGHTLFAVLVIGFLGTSSWSRSTAFDALAFAQLLQIALMLAASTFVKRPFAVWTYRLAAHALVLLWLAWELGPVTTGTGLVTAAWGAYGALLLLLGLRLRGTPARALQLVAFSALALAVAKLFFVDLQRMAMVWRILLFMGFGGAFLWLSSLFKAERGGGSEGVTR